MTDIDWACSQPIMSAYNASGSISFTGFHPLSDKTSGPGNWSLNTAIHNVENVTANTSFLYQTLWLDTSPTVALSSPELQYTGCVFGFYGGLLGTKAVTKGAGANHTCDTVLGLDCQRTILSIAEAQASANVGTGADCGSLIYQLSSADNLNACAFNAFTRFQVEGKEVRFSSCTFITDQCSLSQSHLAIPHSSRRTETMRTHLQRIQPSNAHTM
jgi:hypothetical protein